MDVHLLVLLATSNAPGTSLPVRKLNCKRQEDMTSTLLKDIWAVPCREADYTVACPPWPYIQHLKLTRVFAAAERR